MIKIFCVCLNAHESDAMKQVRVKSLMRFFPLRGTQEYIDMWECLINTHPGTIHFITRPLKRFKSLHKVLWEI